ncbi:MAG TPA: hypothetical protein VM187_18655 [Niastella sp.]|nr:hypothetical protein [Niastella sp.]
MNIQTLPAQQEALPSIPAPAKVVPMLPPAEKELLTLCASIYVNSILNQNNNH